MGISVEKRFNLGKKREQAISQDSLGQDRPKQAVHNCRDQHSEHDAIKVPMTVCDDTGSWGLRPTKALIVR